MAVEPSAAPRDLRPLLDPRSIAVVGASESSRVGANMVRNLLQAGYRGRIYPVNPRYEQVMGLRCYPSLLDIPDEVEAVVVGIGARYVLPTLREAAQKGVRAAVVATVGFAEAGEEGAARQCELEELAAQHGMLVCGPNCMGLISFVNRQAMYIGAIPTRLPVGRVGAVCQSGSVAIALLQSGRVGFSHLISSGNGAVVEVAEYLAYLVEDPHTDVLLAFIEGFRKPGLFLRVADRARELGKPLIALKVGASRKAAVASLAHTGTLAGSDQVCDAMFRQKGVIRVRDVDEMIETGVLFSTLARRRPRGGRVGAVTVSGGQIGMLLDLAEPLGLDFPELTERTRASLAEVLPFVPALSNPLDAWGTGDVEQAYPACLELLADDDNVDVVLVVEDAPSTEGQPMSSTPMHVARAAARVAGRTDKPVVFATTVSGAVDSRVAATLAEAGVPLLLGSRESLGAIAALVRFEATRKRLEQGGAAEDRAPPASRRPLAIPGPHRALSEWESMQVLSDYGIPVVPQSLAHSADEAVAAAECLGFPVAVKVCSADLAHKSEVGAVRLGLEDAGGVRRAYGAVLENVSRAAPTAAIEGVLVQRMVSGVEMIAGLQRDPEFGPVVLVGIGGVLVEVLRDVSLRLAPLTRFDAEAMLGELRGRALLDGYRGQPPADREAIVGVLLALSRLALDWDEQLETVDINPLVVTPGGAFAADALIVLREPVA